MKKLKDIRSKKTLRSLNNSPLAPSESTTVSTVAQGSSTPSAAPTTAQTVLDELLNDMKKIAQLCGTNTATVSVNILSRALPSVAQVRTIKTISGIDGTTVQEVTEDSHQRFHIASLTKPLVAAAIFVAASRKASPAQRSGEDVTAEIGEEQQKLQDAKEKFGFIGDKSLVELYNWFKKDNQDRLDPFHGRPTIIHLLKHIHGFPSTNFQMLAPNGVSIMKLSDSRSEIFDRISNTFQGTKGSVYSNLNYTAIALTIENMWGDFKSFMEANLFTPIGMKLTSIGIDGTEDDKETFYVVDSDRKTVIQTRQPYRSDGAEAAAMGAYSTAHDLDLFHKFMADVYWSKPAIPGCDFKALDELMKLDEAEQDSASLPSFTTLGIRAKLNSSRIGSLSINRTQFPNSDFSTYTVFPQSESTALDVFYMAGSANGCSCVSVFYPGNLTIDGFSVIVLTNTSGPVDAADHLSRLILQKVARMVDPTPGDDRQTPPINIVEMAEQNCVEAFKLWRKNIDAAEKHMRDCENTLRISKSLKGEFCGTDFKQRLVISEDEERKLWIVIDGPVHLDDPLKARLYWIDGSSLKMFVQPHLAIDSLAQGDWADIVFKAEDMNGEVVALSCETPYGKVKFTKRS